ncbi:hypothetical protein KI387_040990, partial [Taxus chinensis]
MKSSGMAAPQKNNKNGLAEDYYVDEAAESFIRSFRQDLRIQRLKSLASNCISPLKSNGNTKDKFGGSSRLKLVGENGNIDTDIDVDKSAEEFIGRFNRNLKMERIESFKRYNEMLGR